MNDMTEHNACGVVFRTADRFSAAGGVVHGFSTRLGGVSEGVWASMNLGLSRGDDPQRVRENYRRFFAALGMDSSPTAVVRQVHGTHIHTIVPEDLTRDIFSPGSPEADGLITHLSGVTLVVFTADCLPILFYDPVCRVICAVHAGWRGSVGGIASKAIKQMEADYGCHPEHILAAMGPAISRCHFETDGDVPAAVHSLLGSRGDSCISHCPGGKFLVDLKEVNRLLLLDAGLSPCHITVDPDCTACQRDKYWSHRFTGFDRGSQAAVIRLL
jgi:YfiH family protein